MKTIKSNLFIFLAVLFFLPVNILAQSEKEKEEMEKEKKEMLREYEKQQKQHAIELEKQKKEMAEELKRNQIQTQQEIERLLKESKVMEEEELRSLIEDQKRVQAEALENYQEALKNMKHDGAWTFKVPEFRFEKWDGESPLIVADNFTFPRESSSMNISKDLQDVTFSTSFEYEVLDGSSTFKFSANGAVSDGTIKIVLKNPAKKVVQEFEVSPLANVDWSRSFRWTDEEKEDYLGKWTIAVSAKDATGRYRVSVRAN